MRWVRTVLTEYFENTLKLCMWNYIKIMLVLQVQAPCVLPVESLVRYLHATFLARSFFALAHRRICFQNLDWSVKDFIFCTVVCCKVERTVVNKARRTDSLIQTSFSGWEFCWPFHVVSSYMLLAHGHFHRRPHVLIILCSFRSSINLQKSWKSSTEYESMFTWGKTDSGHVKLSVPSSVAVVCVQQQHVRCKSKNSFFQFSVSKLKLVFFEMI